MPPPIILALNTYKRHCDAQPCPDPADLCDFNELSQHAVSPRRLLPLSEVWDQRQQREHVPEVPLLAASPGGQGSAGPALRG